MTNYELMFIITPEANEEEREVAIDYVKKSLALINAEKVEVTKMGEKKLAYLINKKATGFYVLVKFAADGTKLNDVENRININEQIMRYILVK